MTKVKEKLYEHRFGLFFFGVLMVFGLVFLTPFAEEQNKGVIYMIYLVDFSFGFCTKLLPGAVYNILVDEFNEESAMAFFYCTLIVCYAGIAYFSQKIVESLDNKNKMQGIIMVTFFISAFCITMVKGRAAYLLDLHWIFSIIIFFIILSNKKFYFLLPTPFFYAIMCHFACVICYIPMFVLIILYKVIICKEKKEQKYLSAVLIITLLLSVSLFFYMLLFETENLNYTYDEFVQLMNDKGIDPEVQYYYTFNYYKGDIQVYNDRFANILESGAITFADPNASKITYFFQTLNQQMKSIFYFDEFCFRLLKSLILLPMSIFLIITFIKKIITKKTIKIKKFIYFNTIALFFFTEVVSFFMSTDNLRWIGHSTLVLFFIFLYMVYLDIEEGYEGFTLIKKIPLGASLVYFIFNLLTILN